MKKPPFTLFPSACIGCGKVIPIKHTPPFCEECGKIWSDMLAYICPACKFPIYKCRCSPCFNTSGVMSHYYALIPYFTQDFKFLSDSEKKFKQLGEHLLLSMKSRRNDEFFEYVSSVLADRIKHTVDEKVVIAYPNRKLAPRLLYGHDQAKILARQICTKLKAPLFEGIYHCNKTNEQKLLDFNDRGKNARDSYYVEQTDSEQVKGKLVVFVDDVLTSGATAAWCASLLRQLGAKDVLGFFLARTCGFRDIEQNRT